MANSSNVPRPSFGPAGFVAPSEAAVLAGIEADLNADFNANFNFGLTTPQGQIASTFTAISGDSNATFIWYCNQVDPALNSGRMQDAIGRIYYMTRIPGAPTVQPCVCSGLDEVMIPNGALVQDENDVLWISQSGGKIVGGSVTLNFACVNNGPTPGPTTLTIYQALPNGGGWDSCTPTGDAVLGNLVESASAFEARRAASVAANARGILDAIQGSVLAVAGVIDCYCIENDLPFAVTIGGVVLSPNSIYVCVLGGAAQDVADAIWVKKAPGCGYTGSSTATVVDPSPKYTPPAPSYLVAFTVPTVLACAVLVVLKNSAGVPATGRSLVQTAIVNAFAGLDGGTRARIGSTVFASRYYGPVALLGSWAQIVDIQVGVTGDGASFTASIAGTTMTVTAIPTGALAAGQLIQDAGSVVASGTTIVEQLTGTTGGTGTYQVSQSQTVPSEAMNATNMVNDFATDIDQAPAVSAVNIQLALV